MDFLIHYLAQNPDFLGFFLFGWLFALGVSFWNRAMQSCLTGAVYLYFFGAFSLTMVLLPLLTATHSREFIVFGFLAYHLKTIISWFSFAFSWVIERKREQEYKKESAKWQQEQATKRQQEQATKRQQEQAQYQQRAREEQARREQEARQYREQQERAKQEQAKAKQRQEEQRRETPKDPPPRQPQSNSAPDTRTPEQILGLATGYTQENLKTAYRRESQRTHPDKWTGKPAHIQAIMEAEYKAIQQAYNRLKKQ